MELISVEIDGGRNNEIDQKCVKIEQSVKVDVDKMTTTKVCNNKFSIESILGLNSLDNEDDKAKSNRLELIDFCQRKGINAIFIILKRPNKCVARVKVLSFVCAYSVN